MCSREQFVGGSGRCQAMISGALLSVLTWMGPGHAGSCSSCRASKRQRRENMIWAPSLERTCSPADLGRRTKQRVRASNLMGERETQGSPGSSLGRPAVYLEILCLSIRHSRRVNREQWLSCLPRNWTRVVWVKTRNPRCLSTRG